MTAIEDARIAVLTAAQQVLHAHTDVVLARANRHLDEALEAWRRAVRPSLLAHFRAVGTLVAEDVRVVHGDRVAAYVEESLRQHLAPVLGSEEVAES